MMNAKILSAVVAGVVALSMGCSDGGSDMGALAIDDPLYSAMTGGSDGTNGQNHLIPDYFIQNTSALYNATTQSIASYDAAHGIWELTRNTHTDALTSTYEGREVLKYALQCALPAGFDVMYWGQNGAAHTVTGQGFLTTTADWKTGALTLSQAEDLMACMVAHMNPYAVVDINLSGETINNDPNADTSGFTFEEALWVVDIGFPAAGVRADTRVWPLRGFLDCGESVDKIETRVCGTHAGTPACGVDVRFNLAGECSEEDGRYKCLDASGNYVAAIRTRLKADQASIIYRACQ
jgi:hypothetical protein